jgi:alkylated DNA repair dioxygenase AlkB
MRSTEWSQETIRYYRKKVKLPRFTAWYGDKGASYTYSKIANDPHRWTDALLALERRFEPIAHVRFNSVLLNLYRTGNDGVSWHQDNEPELGDAPVIASASFGGTRQFQFKHKFQKELSRVDLSLTHGSVLIMRGTTQQFWRHQIVSGTYFLFIDRNQRRVNRLIEGLVNDLGLTTVRSYDETTSMDTDERKSDLGKWILLLGRSPKLKWRASVTLARKP